MVSLESSETYSSISSTRLGREYFDIGCNQLAKSLLGQILVRKENDNILKGLIVETEAYIGGEDLSSHTHHGKMTKRTAPAFMVPGTMYVYPVWFGMYHLFNISSRGDGACVLLRSLEPIFGLEEMEKKRSSFGKNPKKQRKSYKLNELCNGPSKLAIAMNIDSHFSGNDLVTSPEIWIESGPVSIEDEHIVESPRIGIESTDSFWASKPFRYYILGNRSVSKRNKKAEVMKQTH
ncbi:DNA-3-methyladenine glycosylase isoform X2 [Halyomorpha halys]|uniref:DNA-3-methyladenine glycosylase isoform X2 n=1 Tax=Halyomorpha halys TaxID=286706 RepID=UPI0006D4FF96|nr:DNA-3-methyladenine glycosylase-like [Halyomorpha halys]